MVVLEVYIPCELRCILHIKKGFYVCDMYMVKRALFHYIRGNLGCYVAADFLKPILSVMLRVHAQNLNNGKLHGKSDAT